MDCQQKQWCNMLEDIAKRVRIEWYKVCGEFPPSPGPCDPSGVDIKTMMGSRTLEDRDPGDLSGENSFVIGVGFNKSEDEDDASSGNKRKFSASIRDLEQKKKNKILHHTKTRDVTRAQSPLPSPPVAGQQMEEEYGEVTGDSLSRLGDANNLVEDDEDAISTANCLTLSQVRSSDGGALFQGSSPRIMEAQPACESINMLQCCRSVDAFEKLNKIKEGSYGIVYRVRDKKSGEIVALKKVKMGKEQEGFSLNFLREINILLSLHHPSISEVKEVVVGSDLDEIFIVMEYMEHDLKELMDRMNKPFHVSEIKCLMLQLLSGVKHLHDNWVLHRDLTPSNLLFNNRGELKICDFGLSRQYDSPLKPYTQLVVTLWYRAPELLFGAKEYSTSIDMWSLGCIMSELLTKEPLFSGKTDLDQLDKIYCVLGTPDDKIWPGFTRLSGAFLVKFSKQVYELHDKFPLKTFRSFLRRSLLSDTGFDLLSKLLTYDPEKRITAEEALNHPWFLESPLPTSKEFMPTFPVQHTQDRELC